MLYTLSSFITTVKEDIGIKDIPLPVSDEDILSRFFRSALTDFSILYPRVETILMNQHHRIGELETNIGRCVKYRIPKFIYDDSVVLNVTRFELARGNGLSDLYAPMAPWGSPDMVISAVADIRMTAGLSASMCKSPTHFFKTPDIIEVYNSWSGGVYEVEILLRHDHSLASIQDGAFMELRELTALDMQWYLYGELKRKDNLDAGIGNIQLKIDDWANSGADYKALIKQWRDDGASMDFEHIKYF